MSIAACTPRRCCFEIGSDGARQWTLATGRRLPSRPRSAIGFAKPTGIGHNERIQHEVAEENEEDRQDCARKPGMRIGPAFQLMAQRRPPLELTKRLEDGGEPENEEEHGDNGRTSRGIRLNRHTLFSESFFVRSRG